MEALFEQVLNAADEAVDAENCDESGDKCPAQNREPRAFFIHICQPRKRRADPAADPCERNADGDKKRRRAVFFELGLVLLERLMRFLQQLRAGFLFAERVLFHPQQKRNRKIRADARQKVGKVPFELEGGG